MLESIKLVFTNHKYVILAGVIFVGMLFPLLIISEFIFLEPYVIIYIPFENTFSFSLIIVVSMMSGIVLAMNVYRIRELSKKAHKMGGSVIGSIIGASAGACSCGPIGFAIISTFGSVGGAATAFLSNYEIPLRLGAIGILAVVYYTTTKSLSAECKIKN